VKKIDVVNELVADRSGRINARGKAFAPINIALIKYWGKRDAELNLPLTSSLSISLPPLGSATEITLAEVHEDVVVHNGREMTKDSEFYQRITHYLDLFRTRENFGFIIETTNNIPTAGGLASSASGYAALIMALDDLFAWHLTARDLSILARLGSGSACRSIHRGFVEWQAGALDSGMDSYAMAIDTDWPELCLGIITVVDEQKSLSSREAMKRTIGTSLLYQAWPSKVTRDLQAIKQAIITHDFQKFGQIAENNALTMHAAMLAAWPPISYWRPGTLDIFQRVWALREGGLPVYLTLDAGPNPVLLFIESERTAIVENFPNIFIINPAFEK
jgi:diphosphomevalonate decarboxylase